MLLAVLIMVVILARAREGLNELRKRVLGLLGFEEALLNCPIIDTNSDRILSERSCKTIVSNP